MRAAFLQPYSERGWLVNFRDAAERDRVLAALDRQPLVGLSEFVTGFENLLLLFHDPQPREAIEAWLEGDSAEPEASGEGGIHHRIPVRYDGPDLEEVAQAIGASVDEVIALHSGTTYRVITMGFSPGFPYLGPLDSRLHLPRKETPRPHVPPGSVAIGGEHAGIYPTASAGGWHLLGTTDFPLFHPERAKLEHPDPREVFTLAPGDRVTFVPTP